MLVINQPIERTIGRNTTSSLERVLKIYVLHYRSYLTIYAHYHVSRGNVPRGEDFFKTHVLVYHGFEVLNDDHDVERMLERIFEKFNSSEENPLSSGILQEYLRLMKTHTSMSVGDIVVIEGDGAYAVQDFGFQKIADYDEIKEKLDGFTTFFNETVRALVINDLLEVEEIRSHVLKNLLGVSLPPQPSTS